MRTTSKLILFVFTLTLAASAYAQSPRVELQQMVEQLQKTPTDNALREKIIQLAQELKPAPAIPEEATRSFVKGNVFQKEAKDVSGYDLAISAYREALRVAPWWGDAYFNLSVALEAAGKFDEAITTTKHYMASVPAGSAEAREAQNRIYAIEAKSEMASRQAKAAVQQAEIEKKRNRYEKLSGRWTGVGMTNLTVKIAADGSCTATSTGGDIEVDSCKVVDDKLQFHSSSRYYGYQMECEFDYTTDGQRMYGRVMSGGHGRKDEANAGCYYLHRP
jgi:tetratricopeptide (TPR) repeat protein